MPTEKEQLKYKYDQFYKLEFPSEPSGLDIIAELAEDDGYIAGNVSTFLSDSPVEHPLHGVRKEIFERIENYKPKTKEDQKNLEYIKFYIGTLGELNELLKDYFKHKN